MLFRSLCVYNGDVYAGGNFTTAGGDSTNYIAKWNNPLGVENNFMKEEVNIYPTPSTDKIYITHTNSEEIEIKLFDIIGKQVNATIKNKNLITEIDVSGLSEGIYFVSVKTSEGILTKKIIVQR